MAYLIWKIESETVGVQERWGHVDIPGEVPLYHMYAHVHPLLWFYTHMFKWEELEPLAEPLLLHWFSKC